MKNHIGVSFLWWTLPFCVFEYQVSYDQENSEYHSELHDGQLLTTHRSSPYLVGLNRKILSTPAQIKPIKMATTVAHGSIAAKKAAISASFSISAQSSSRVRLAKVSRPTRNYVWRLRRMVHRAGVSQSMPIRNSMSTPGAHTGLRKYA